MTKQKQTPMTATACFELIKKSKNVADHKFLNELEKTTKPMLDKAFAIGQEYKIRQLLFTLQVIAKEKTLVDLGFSTYVYRDDVEQFVDMYAETNDSKHIAIIELEKYEREIPNHIAEDVLRLKELGIFDRFLIAYTDYTQKTKKRVEKERDPIIFGIFERGKGHNVEIYDKMYFIGDWEDDYCDLTLEKMVDAMAKKKKKDIKHSTFASTDIKSIEKYMEKLSENDDKTNFRIVPNKKPTVFKKVTRVLKSWIGQ